ncbi:hypothetical protein DOTSEDRAFT_75709 [Dothistroma septosporum NZE10]|uniref:Uncharacterized protein n=1 Tax=Dothistroma septosporum (strain NZE10 / CBS 128990) TaxID=675120 RepID=N1PDF2_DOTSN|nr:hypothetical protein DOTSEDRAFT_75709 [Dothistroma septosporum NZE10]
MQKCARSMEQRFGVFLYQLKDKTLRPGADYSNPKDLDRNGIFVLCRERLHRMRTVCNKKWRTKDNEEKLYLEIGFQYCCSFTKKPGLQWLKAKYGDRLGLPLVIWLKSPLRFSIAHHVHGGGILTGGRSKEPKDVKERMFDENNMLMESWYWNSSKVDMAEEYYGELQKTLSAARITDTNIYHSGSMPAAVPGVKMATGELKEDIVDQFTGSAFGSLTDVDDDVPAGPGPVVMAGSVATVSGAAASEAADQGEGVANQEQGGELLENGGVSNMDNGTDDTNVTAAADALGLLGAATFDQAALDDDNFAQEIANPFNTIISNTYGELYVNEMLQFAIQYDQSLRTNLANLQSAANEKDADKFRDVLDDINEEHVSQAP